MQTCKKHLFPLLAAAGYMAACLLFHRYTGLRISLGLAWNIFLALLPGLFFPLALRCRGFLRWAVLALWLLFLPNTFYILTDLVHVPEEMAWYAVLADGRAGLCHTRKLTDWALLILIGLGAWMGLSLGLCGLSDFYDLCRKKCPAPVALAGVAAVSGLCGVGICIGRFLRLNSWDILRPAYLAATILAAVDGFFIKMSLLIAAAILLLFLFWRGAASRRE